MSAPTGIPTYTSSPLKPNKSEEEGTQASNLHPEPATTIESSTTATTQPPNTSATATAPSYSPIYATAQPGAAPGLQEPTGLPISQFPGTDTATPTTNPPTVTTSTQFPAPPQAGAMPEPTTTNTFTSSQSPIPPPPKAGEAPSSSLQSNTYATTPAAPSAPFTQSYSYQPPNQTQSSIPNSTSSPYTAVYQSPASRGSQPQTLPLHYSSVGGGASSIFPEEEPGFLNTAKSWMQSAGTKLAEVEAEVWKRINNAHDEE